VLRSSARLALASVVVLSFGLCLSADAQQFDAMVGYSTLRSSKSNNASVAYIGPAETGGNLAGAGVNVYLKDRFGVNGEFAFMYKQGLYNGFQGYRPIFYDVNGLYSPQFTKRIKADFMAGFGGETILFYNSFSNCAFAVCTTYTNSTHLLGHLGAGARYYFWRNLFVRPEAHLYIIHNNFQFSSAYVGRLGGSVGYTFGSHTSK
jgi:hypothetical protein